MDKASLVRLFKEKSLIDLMKTYERSFKAPFYAYNIAVFVFVVSFGILLTACFGYKNAAGKPAVDVINVVQTLDLVAPQVNTIAVGALSIAIAGFAIFASGLSDDSLKSLVAKNKPGTSVPLLVYTFSMFIYTMVVLLLLIMTAFVSLAVSSEKSAFRLFLLATSPTGHNIVVLTALSVLLAQTAFSLSILKSFIWNLYQTMLSIAAFKMLDK